MIRTASQAGFTMAEVMIATGGSIIILGSLFAASVGLQKSFAASEHYAQTQSDERRLIDTIARDLRRAISVAVRTPGGAAVSFDGSDFTLGEGAELQLQLPPYYRSDTPTDPNYDRSLAVVGTGTGRVDYGTAAGAAPPVLVTYRKVYFQPEDTMCFVREEAGTREVVVRDATGMTFSMSAPSSRETLRLRASFRGRFSRQGRAVAVHDDLMIRNQRVDR